MARTHACTPTRFLEAINVLKINSTSARMAEHRLLLTGGAGGGGSILNADDDSRNDDDGDHADDPIGQ